MAATESNYCPKCKQFMPQMSGVELRGHNGKHYYLCFNCKCWFNEKGEFEQTI